MNKLSITAVFGYWHRGMWRRRPTSDICIQLEFGEAGTMKDLWAAAKAVRAKHPDLKGKRVTLISKTKWK